MNKDLSKKSLKSGNGTGDQTADVSDTQNIFTDNGVENIASFCNTLKKIHTRLLSEGYVFKNGAIIKQNNGN